MIRFYYTLLSMLTAFMLTGCGLLSSRAEATSYYRILPANTSDDADEEWASYLCKHLDKRSSEKKCVVDDDHRPEGKKEIMTLIVDVNPRLATDFSISHKDKRVTLAARNEKRMLWLIYQVISMIGEKDARIDTNDLPVSAYTLDQDAKGNATFDYCTIYSRLGTNEDTAPILGLGNLDTDWGLWGHNLNKVLPSEPDKSIFSTVHGNRNIEQFCFSSGILFKYISEYIDKQHYDEDEHERFVIMPNDDATACTCANCLALGNTEKNATPAATALVERLAKKYPSHMFFTSYYISTAHIPDHKLPKNVGVLISAIDMPMQVGVTNTKAGKNMDALLAKWAQVCSNIYIWDYDRNFDDYLTPYPCLTAFKERLQMYARHGVKGLVINDSGSDYASFDELQNNVLGQMMIDPNIDIKASIKRFCKQKFPKTADLVANYYISLEETAEQRQKVMEFYGGIDDAVNAYLTPEWLNVFYDKLDKASKTITGAERTRINYLLTGLSFTQLELMRRVGQPQNKATKGELLASLKGHNELEGMKNFREVHADLEPYINYMSKHDVVATGLFSPEITGHSELDFGGKPFSILTDGYLGIPYDYHTNWLIHSSDELTVNFAPNNRARKALHIGSLFGSPWRIELPASAEVWQNGKLICRNEPRPEGEESMQRVDIVLDLSRLDPTQPYMVKIYKLGRKFAIDEIALE